MNAKLCKKLRAIARAKTEGMPARRLVEYKQRLSMENAQARGGSFVIGAANDPQSTRGVYRALKATVRRLPPGGVLWWAC